MTFERPKTSGQPDDLSGISGGSGKSGRKGKIILGVVILLVLAGVAFAIFRPHAATEQAAGGGRRGQRAVGTVPVGVASAKIGNIRVTLDAQATVTPLATVTVKTQLAGLLQKIAFTEGQMVKAGDFLAQIDPRPYEAQLAQYQGQLKRDQGLLQGATVDMQRYKTLVEQDSIAKQTYDDEVALVEQYKGTVLADQAQIEQIKVDLAWCHITSPLTGRVGLRQVDQGNYVQPSDANGIVVVTQLEPISIVFVLAEDNIPAVLAKLHQGESLQVDAFDRGALTKLGTGTVSTIDNQIDTSTGTVKLRAMFDNKDEMLFPNQFVNARLLVDTHKDVVLVPASAILTGQPGTFVYLLKDDNTVTVRPIKTGVSNAERVEVLSGLQAGDRVVVDGTDKLREGASVVVAADTDKGATLAGTAAGGERRARGKRGDAANGAAPTDGKAADGKPADGKGGDTPKPSRQAQ